MIALKHDYIVIRRDDLVGLPHAQEDALKKILKHADDRRREQGGGPLQAVTLEKHSPHYQTMINMIAGMVYVPKIEKHPPLPVDNVEPCRAEFSDVLNYGCSPESSGGSVNYYKLDIKHPANLPEPYTCEAEDIIEALGMTFAEGNQFKSIWRSCAQRVLGKLKAGLDGIREAEKMVYYAQRTLAVRKRERGE